MTNSKLLVGTLLILAAGCSSASSTTTADAPVATIDAPVAHIDAAVAHVDAAVAHVDAAASTVDASVTTADANTSSADAGSFSASAVWIAGDFITNNTQQLGHFTFPVASPPIVPSVFPTSSTALDLVNFSSPYSVSKDGTTIAYAQVVTTGDQLFVGGVSGSSPTLLFTATGAHITDVALSADGSHIAFRSDMVLSGMFDNYFISATAPNPTPVKMSPNRAANSTDLDGSGFMTWSDDSRFVAYTGQFVAKGRFELHVFDVANASDAVLLPDASITTAGTSSVGVLAPAQFDSNNNVFYLALFDGTNQLIYTSTANASMQPQTFTAAVATNNVGAAKVTSFALSPDRSTIAFVEDATTQTAFELFTADTAGVNAKKAQTTGHTAGQSIDPLAETSWNHAGTKIAFHADYGATANKFQPYVLTLQTSALIRVATVGDDTDATRNSQDAIAWSTDDSSVFIISDGGATDNAFSVSAQGATTTDGAITFLVTPPTSGDIFDVFMR